MTPIRLKRRAFLLLTAGAAASTRGAAFASGPNSDIEIAPKRRSPIFEGWGVSLAWWGYIVGGWPLAARLDVARKVFDARRGLGLTYARYNIGGGENPKYHFMQKRACVPGYEPQPERWNWLADKNQVQTLRDAIRMGVNIIEGFSNSPPYWMTVSGSVTGGVGEANNLKLHSYKAFARYLAIVTAHFQRVWGIHFWSFGNFIPGARTPRLRPVWSHFIKRYEWHVV